VGIAEQRTEGVAGFNSRSNACRLGEDDRDDLLRFLSADRARNVYLLWRIQHGALARHSRFERILGVRDDQSGELVAALGAGANMVPAGNDATALEELGACAGITLELPRMLIGSRSGVDAVWRGYQQVRRPLVKLDTLHSYYELDRPQLNSDYSLPRLRLACAGDLLEVEEASAQMLEDDLGRLDREENPGLFRRRVRHAIAQEDVHVLCDDGRLQFKVNRGPRAHDSLQLQGVFTARSHRGQQLGRRGCAEVCRRAFDAGVSTVNLFVREDNLAARRAYEAVGFRQTGQFRMIILDPGHRNP